MSRSLPPRPDLEHLKKEAKDLLKAYRARNPAVREPLRHLRDLRELPDREFFERPLTLQEVQFALALDYGFANWTALRDHVLRLRIQAAAEEYAPSREDVLAFYLREDVSHVLWEFSRRRALRFFYRRDGAIGKSGTEVDHTTLHCVESPGEFRERVERLIRDASPAPSPFYPYFEMSRKAVTKPGRRDEPIGWDYRLEFDFDLAGSFRALLPVVALLRHFDVPALTKFSGHRSLHVIIPPEAFPGTMRKQPDKKQWMAVFDQLARFLCRFCPMLNKCAAGLAKDFQLTAPYSLHRYKGRISLPLSYEDLWEFDPDRARCDRFEGVSWKSEDLDSEGEGMKRLLAAAERAEAEPATAVELAEEIFAGGEWDGFVAASAPKALPSDPARAALTTGLPATGWLARQPSLTKQIQQRARSVMARMESPETKSARIGGLTGPSYPGHPNFGGAREPLAESLAVWVNEGFSAFLNHLRQDVLKAELGAPVTFAVRVLSMVPEPEEKVFEALHEKWSWPPEPEPVALFHALALAELHAFREPVLDLFPSDDDRAERLKEHLLNAGAWQVQERPELVLAVMALMFGVDRIREWTEAWDSEESLRAYGPVFGSSVADDGSTHLHRLDRLRHATKQMLRLAAGEEVK